MKKQIISLGALIVIVLAIIYGVPFFSNNLSGIIPLLKNPSIDIVDIIKEQEKNSIPTNSTEFPLTLPENVSISIFAEGLESPRVLARDPSGHLVVSMPKKGSVVVLPDRNNDGKADETITIISNLNKPHGVAFHCFLDKFGIEQTCELYIAETDQVVVYDYNRGDFSTSNRRIVTNLPSGKGHSTRTLFLDTLNNRLLTSVGSSCNVCNESDERRAAILTTDLTSGITKVFARGLRNAVFMTEHPITKELWVTEMGRDLLGDDIPPDEINIVREGENYGWPDCYGKNVHDFDFDGDIVYIRAPCSTPFEQPSHIDLQAHSAPLGLAFIPETGWPEQYENDLLVAYHGSWNRSVPTGYKIMRLNLDASGAYLGMEDFITGWLTEGGEVLGRPTDILIDPDGVMFVTDDRAGVVYRIIYK